MSSQFMYNLQYLTMKSRHELMLRVVREVLPKFHSCHRRFLSANLFAKQFPHFVFVFRTPCLFDDLTMPVSDAIARTHQRPVDLFAETSTFFFVGHEPTVIGERLATSVLGRCRRNGVIRRYAVSPRRWSSNPRPASLEDLDPLVGQLVEKLRIRYRLFRPIAV